MSELLKTALKSLPDYLTFLVAFVSSPRATMRKYSRKEGIDGTLVTHVILGLLLSWGIVRILPYLLPHNHREFALEVLTKVFPDFSRIWSTDREMIPLVMGAILIIVVVLFAGVAHGVSRLWALIGDADSALGGTLWDTVNAGLGFVAFFLPLQALLFTADVTVHYAALFGDISIRTEFILFWLGVLLESASTMLYLPAALSGTHPYTSFKQAGLAMCFMIMPIVGFRWLFVHF
jgi:hypothetical protein